MARWVRHVIPILALTSLICAPSTATGQSFGAQARADQVPLLVLIGVTQATSTLPPSSGQSFLFQYDPALDTYVASSRLGPTAFRTAQTIGRGNFGLRFAGSYLDLNRNFDTIAYGGSRTPNGETVLFTRLGHSVDAQVGIMSLSGTYGLLDALDIDLNVPVTIVSAQADESFVTCSNDSIPGCTGTEPISDAPVVGARTLDILDAALADGRLAYRSGTARELGADFNEDTSVGLGRISLGGKWVFYETDGADLAFDLRLQFPSPSEDDFAGPDSWALDPRFIGEIRVSEDTRILLDLGYSNDFTFDELSSFQWSLGASYGLEYATFDAGFAGSVFREGAEWSPNSFCQPDSGVTECLPEQATFYQVLEDNRLETFYANFLGGMKFRLGERQVVATALNVPLNGEEGIRPDVVVTATYELYF